MHDRFNKYLTIKAIDGPVTELFIDYGLEHIDVFNIPCDEGCEEVKHVENLIGVGEVDKIKIGPFLNFVS